MNAVSSDDWACRKHLCFSLDICYHQWRLSLYRERYSRPHSRWPLLRLNAPRDAVLPKTTVSHGFSQATRPPVRCVRDIHCSCLCQFPRSVGRAATLCWEEAGQVLLWARPAAEMQMWCSPEYLVTVQLCRCRLCRSLYVLSDYWSYDLSHLAGKDTFE